MSLKKEKNYLICKHHDAIVGFSSQCSAYTLGCMPHSVEGQEVILSDLVLVSQILQASL